MKSVIKPDIDFDNCQSVIDIYEQPSDELEDKVIARFRSDLGQKSNWVRVLFMISEDKTKIVGMRLIPVKSSDLESEIDIMQDRINSEKEKTEG